MKNLVLSLIVLVAGSFNTAAAAQTLSGEEAMALFLGSANQLVIANENPYEQYDETVLQVLSRSLLSNWAQPTVTSAQCKIESGRELCVINIHHVDDPATTDLSDEYSTQFQFEIVRQNGKAKIKNNRVLVASAG